MQFKSVFALSGILVFTGAAIGAQTVSRWLRLPYGSKPPVILRHQLGAPQSPGFSFQFSYEKIPVRPLERLINRAIPEAAPAPFDSEELPGAGQNALKLEELDREAEEILANPPASISFTHLFLQQQKKPQSASQTGNIANSPELTATGSFSPPASGTMPATGTINIKATGTAVITATAAQTLPAPAETASDTAVEK